jgi:hypothetical protein
MPKHCAPASIALESGQHGRLGPWAGERAFRRPNAKEHFSSQLSSRRQCIVATGAGDGTWTCVLSSTGAHWCPPLHEPTGPRLTENAMLDKRGVLKLDTPLTGTHPAPRLARQRYPRDTSLSSPSTAS